MAGRNISNLWGLIPGASVPDEQTDVQRAGAWAGNVRFLSSAKDADRLLALIDSCQTANRIEPKKWAQLTRVMLDRVPLVKRAMKIHMDMVGNAIIPDEARISDNTRELAQWFMDTVPLLSESMPEESQQSGFNTLLRKVLKDCLIEGTAFLEERFKTFDGEIQDEYLGVMVFDPTNWNYDLAPGNRVLTATYTDRQQPHYRGGVYMPSPYFHQFVLETDHGNPWGLPFLRGGLLAFRVLVALLLCIDLQAKRFGNPPTLTLLTSQDPARFADKKQQEQYFELLEVLRDDVAEAWDLVQKGRAADIVAAMPGEHGVHTGTLGADMNSWVSDDMLWKISILACNVLEVPPALLNINDVGGGLGGDMFRNHYKLLTARAQSHREAIRPSLESIVRNFLLNQGVAPAEAEEFCIEFEAVNLDDMAASVEVEKLQAETVAQQLENITNMEMMGLDPTEYSESTGIIPEG